MKYLQIAALVVVGAVGGALFMKWKSQPTPAVQPPPVEQAAPPATAVPPSEAPPPAAVPQSAAPVSAPAQTSRRAARQRPSPMAPGNSQAGAPAAATAPPASSSTASAPVAAAPATSQAVTTPAPPPPPPPPHRVTLAAGTLLPVRTVEALSSDRNQPGDTFTATLDQPLVVDGFVIAERGAKLEGRVVESRRAGRVKGVSDLAIELTRLSTSDGQKVEIQTETFEKQGPTSKGSDAAKVGAAAGIGAAIGAIAGGGKGAGIGAVVGGAAGTGGVLATRGKPAVIHSETRITFRLREPVTITEKRR